MASVVVTAGAMHVAVRDFLGTGGAHFGDGDVEHQRNAGQRMIAVDHDLAFGDV